MARCSAVTPEVRLISLLVLALFDIMLRQLHLVLEISGMVNRLP